MTTQIAAPPAPAPPATPAPRYRWPTLAGLGFAALVVFDATNGVELAPVLAAAAAIYATAAALRKPSAAWPLFFATAALITVMSLLGVKIQATWVILGAGAVLALVGLLRGVTSPADGLPLQSLALLGFGAAALVGTLINPDLGGYVVAAGLLGHAGWDVYHYRTRKVVARTLAEFCMAFDATLAVVVVLLTALT